MRKGEKMPDSVQEQKESGQRLASGTPTRELAPEDRTALTTGLECLRQAAQDNAARGERKAPVQVLPEPRQEGLKDLSNDLLTATDYWNAWKNAVATGRTLLGALEAAAPKKRTS
jgi:hypothetical protein